MLHANFYKFKNIFQDINSFSYRNNTFSLHVLVGLHIGNILWNDNRNGYLQYDFLMILGNPLTNRKLKGMKTFKTISLRKLKNFVGEYMLNSKL